MEPFPNTNISSTKTLNDDFQHYADSEEDKPLTVSTLITESQDDDHDDEDDLIESQESQINIKETNIESTESIPTVTISNDKELSKDQFKPVIVNDDELTSEPAQGIKHEIEEVHEHLLDQDEKKDNDMSVLSSYWNNTEIFVSQHSINNVTGKISFEHVCSGFVDISDSFWNIEYINDNFKNITKVQCVETEFSYFIICLCFHHFFD